MSLYLDTSVIVPYYCPEINSEKVQRELTSRSNFCISSLTFVEIHSALARKIRKRELSHTEARSISTIFKKHVNKGYYKKVSLQKKHYLQAEEWLKQFNINCNLRSLDALQLSAAVFANLPIFTLDTRLADAARLFNIPCKFLGC